MGQNLGFGKDAVQNGGNTRKQACVCIRLSQFFAHRSFIWPVDLSAEPNSLAAARLPCSAVTCCPNSNSNNGLVWLLHFVACQLILPLFHHSSFSLSFSCKYNYYIDNDSELQSY